MDILTDYCIQHDDQVKQIQGDTGTDISLRDREILTSIRTATTNIQLYDITISGYQENQKQIEKIIFTMA